MMEREANALASEILDALLNAKRADADAALGEVLDLLTERSGQNKYRYAASIMRGTKLGRREIDDREALRRIAAFPKDRRHGAVGAIAAKMALATGTRAESIERRLRRKMPKTKTDKMVQSVCSNR